MDLTYSERAQNRLRELEKEKQKQQRVVDKIEKAKRFPGHFLEPLKGTKYYKLIFPLGWYLLSLDLHLFSMGLSLVDNVLLVLRCVFYYVLSELHVFSGLSFYVSNFGFLWVGLVFYCLVVFMFFVLLFWLVCCFILRIGSGILFVFLFLLT